MTTTTAQKLEFENAWRQNEIRDAKRLASKKRRRRAKSQRYLDETLRLFARIPKYTACGKGRFRILEKVIPAGEQITVVSARSSLFGGPCGTTNVTFDTPIKKHSLHDSKNDTWMTTALQEIGQMAEPVNAARGRVLVGGLGLGAVAHLIAQQPKVTDVDVDEIERGIISLVQPFLCDSDGYPLRVVHRDLFEHLKFAKPNAYDFAFFDIWQATGEHSWTKFVVPLRRLAYGKIDKVMCWQESEMKGQVCGPLSFGLWRAADEDVDALERGRVPHWWVFRKACMAAGIRKKHRLTRDTSAEKMLSISEENRGDVALQALASVFVDHVGSPAWERTFGDLWDTTEAWKEIE